MSGFTKTFKYETEFDGDKVQFTLSRMTRKDVMLVTPMLAKIDKSISEEEAMEVTNQFIDVLKACVVNMTGLTDEEGNEVSVETMLEEQYFFALSSEVISVLMERSNPIGGAKAKK